MRYMEENTLYEDAISLGRGHNIQNELCSFQGIEILRPRPLSPVLSASFSRVQFASLYLLEGDY